VAVYKTSDMFRSTVILPDCAAALLYMRAGHGIMFELDLVDNKTYFSNQAKTIRTFY